MDDGAPVGTEPVYSTRSVTKTVSQRNPDYDPNEFLEDGTTPNPDYDPNFVIREEITYDEEYMSGYTGTPLYNMGGNVNNFMPYSYDESGNQIPG